MAITHPRHSHLFFFLFSILLFLTHTTQESTGRVVGPQHHTHHINNNIHSFVFPLSSIVSARTKKK
jgi:hypothetical protein